MRILHCSKNDAMADDMCLRMLKASLLIVAVVLSKSALGADDPSKAPEPAIRTVDSNAPAAPSSPTRANGVVMLDYQKVKSKEINRLIPLDFDALIIQHDDAISPRRR